jgi:hypothetical protein
MTPRRPYFRWSICLLLSITGPTLCSEIKFSSMPGCASGSCLPFHTSSIGCTKFTKSCFCTALAPLNCARSNCTGNDWYALEDWYGTQCPGEPPTLNLDPGIPLEARKCTPEWIVPQQCKASITRNCFCRMQNVTVGIQGCIVANTGATSQQAATLADDFYRDTCVLKEDATGELRPGATADEEVIAAPSPLQSSVDDPRTKQLGLIIGLLAIFITNIGVLW